MIRSVLCLMVAFQDGTLLSNRFISSMAICIPIRSDSIGKESIRTPIDDLETYCI
jgi:hypothetical protein